MSGSGNFFPLPLPVSASASATLVKESLFISRPSIDENPGRHLLPQNHDQLLQDKIKKTMSAVVHDYNFVDILKTALRRPGRQGRNWRAFRAFPGRPWRRTQDSVGQKTTKGREKERNEWEKGENI